MKNYQISKTIIALYYCKLSAYSMAMITQFLSNKIQIILYIKTTTNKFRINYIEEISIKSNAKKMKDYQISKIIIALYYCLIFISSLLYYF